MYFKQCNEFTFESYVFMPCNKKLKSSNNFKRLIDLYTKS